MLYIHMEDLIMELDDDILDEIKITAVAHERALNIDTKTIHINLDNTEHRIGIQDKKTMQTIIIDEYDMLHISMAIKLALEVKEIPSASDFENLYNLRILEMS